MSKNKIIEETVETIIDNIEEKLVDYMFDLGDYSETNNKFYSDKEELLANAIWGCTKLDKELGLLKGNEDNLD